MVFQKRELDKQWLQLEVLINISYIQIKIVRRVLNNILNSIKYRIRLQVMRPQRK